MEVLYGLHHKDAARQLANAEAAFKRNDVIVPEFQDFEAAGRVRGRARRQGRQLSTDDCLIGVVAHRLGLPVATGNTAHFEAMRDAGLVLELQNWRSP